MSPGITPPRNKRGIDSSAIRPNKIIGKDGGIKIPNVPAAAVNPIAKEVLYPFSSISGTSKVPIAMVVAAEDPVIAAKTAVAATPAIAKPPRTQPIHANAASKRTLASPPPCINTAERMKKGTEIKIGDCK